MKDLQLLYLFPPGDEVDQTHSRVNIYKTKKKHKKQCFKNIIKVKELNKLKHIVKMNMHTCVVDRFYQL